VYHGGKEGHVIHCTEKVAKYCATAQLPHPKPVSNDRLASLAPCCHQFSQCPDGSFSTANRDNCIASMQKHLKRTPRACEGCRLARRRCEPPYPCRQCMESGISCDVRAKARPQRRQRRQHQQTTWASPSIDSRDSGRSYSTDAAGSPDHEPVDPGRSPVGRQTAQGDTYELLKGLVQDMLQQRHGT